MNFASILRQLVDNSAGAGKAALRASDEAALLKYKAMAQRASELANAAKAKTPSNSYVVKGGNIDEVVDYIQDDYWKPASQVDEVVDIPEDEFVYKEFGVDKGSQADIDAQRTSENGGVYYTNTPEDNWFSGSGTAARDAALGGGAGFVTADGDLEDKWDAAKKGAVLGAAGGKALRSVDPKDYSGHLLYALSNNEKPAATHVGAAAAAVAVGRDGKDRDSTRKLYTQAEGILNTVAEVKGGIPQANDLTKAQRQVINRFIRYQLGESHKSREQLSASEINSFLHQYYSRT
jgi:hypothetical protein